MLARHDSFKGKTKMKVINLGRDHVSELTSLYADLAGSKVPLNDEDRTLIADLYRAGFSAEVKAAIRENKPKDTIILDVPIDLKGDFEKDIEGSIRDLGGLQTVSVSPYIQRREKIDECIDNSRVHPFSTLVYDASKGGQFNWNMLTRPRLESGGYGRVEKLRPIVNPDAARFVHIDPALRNDSLGLCIAHISEWVDVQRRKDDQLYTERAPVYWIDLILRVVPPPGDEIVLADVRNLIYELSDRGGYTITKVTADSYNSADTLQILSTKGYSTDLLSVDREADAYDNLKAALYEGRVNYYRYSPLLKELRELELHFLGSSHAHRRKRKIDHPSSGSKDCADAIAGVCFSLLTQREVQPVPFIGGETHPNNELWMVEQRHAAAAGNENAGHNQRLDDMSIIPPFLIGNDSDDWDGEW
jgi:hypothetical protein